MEIKMQQSISRPTLKLIAISEADELACYIDFSNAALQLCTLTGQLLFTKEFKDENGGYRRLQAYLKRLSKDQLMHSLCNDWDQASEDSYSYLQCSGE